MFDIYEEITNRIIDEMEKGIIPWQRPWTSSNGAVSHITGRPYSLLNQILLLDENDLLDKENCSKEFLTYKQVQEIGGRVKKGEKSKFVVFWKVYTKEIVTKDGEKKVESIPLLKYYNVFEVNQCENISHKWSKEKRADLQTVEEAENVVKNYFDREKCKLFIRESDKAFYAPLTDSVCVPKLSQYDIEAEYYSTLFHEMVHSTGHKTRLDRLSDWKPKSQEYAKEELVAELGSVFLLNKTNIDCKKAFKNSVGYLQGWSRALKEDKKMFVSAASKAEKAVNYIINGKEQENVD